MTLPALSPAARVVLLALVRRALHSELSGRARTDPVDLSPELQRPAGAFVTLRAAANGGLRG